MASNPLWINDLLESLKARYPPSLPPESWYLVAASALVAGSDPAHLGRIWLYLIKQPDYESADQRRALNKRLKEFIMKQWVTIGIVKSAVAFLSLIKEEQPGDADMTFSRSHTALNEANREAGANFLSLVYGPERSTHMMQAWGPDFEWLTKDVVYGLFFADDRVLGNLETELITYTSIASLGLHVPLISHLQGLQRMGLSVEEAEGVTACAEMVATWGGQDTSLWPKVRELLPDWK